MHKRHAMRRAVCVLQGEDTTARGLYEESLAFYRQLGDRLGIAEILEDFANSTRTRLSSSPRTSSSLANPLHCNLTISSSNL